MQRSYYILHTKRHCEERSARRLRGALFAVYQPLIVVIKRRGPPLQHPLLPRHLFVAHDGRPVDEIERVAADDARVLRYGLEPVMCGQNVIDAFKARELNGIVQLSQVPMRMRSLMQGKWLQPLDSLFQPMKGEARAYIFDCVMTQDANMRDFHRKLFKEICDRVAA